MSGRQYNDLWKTLTPLFLLGYLLNIVPFGSFHHSFNHRNHSELHTPEAEADSCHRAIYHGDVSSNCNHANHVTEEQTACELCKVLTSRSKQFLGTSFAENHLFSFFIPVVHFGSDFILGLVLLQSFLRGPPSA